jgi:hypothetical protein
VVAKIEGSDPKLKNEYVIYSAHWDHLGVDPGSKRFITAHWITPPASRH